MLKLKKQTMQTKSMWETCVRMLCVILVCGLGVTGTGKGSTKKPFEGDSKHPALLLSMSSFVLLTVLW